MLLKTRVKTPSGTVYSVFHTDNPWDPKEIRLHCQFSPDLQTRLMQVKDIMESISEQFPPLFPHPVLFRVYNNTRNGERIQIAFAILPPLQNATNDRISKV